MKIIKCFHCQELIPKGVFIKGTIQGKQEDMCCYGCKAVAEFISEEGYCEFYDYRGDSTPATKADVADEKWLQYDETISFDSLTQATKNNTHIVSIRLEGIYCSACGWLIDKHLRKMKGVIDVKLNTLTKLLHVEFDVREIKLSQVFTAINFLGYQPIASQEESSSKLVAVERRNALKRLIVSGLGMMFIMTLSVPLYGNDYKGFDPTIRRFFELVSLLMSTGVYFYAGSSFLQNALRDISNKHLGMDVPIALSISLAYFFSVWNVLTHNGESIYFDSMVMFIFFLLAGRYVEMSVRHQGMSINDALGSMIPVSVKVIVKSGIKLVPINSIQKGDVIIAETGETIAIDGTIIQGSASVNESMITGESIAVSRKVKDLVLAGSIVDHGKIHVKATAIGDETMLSNLSDLLEKTQLQKPKTLQIVDKVASWFVAIVLLVAIATALYYYMYQPDKMLITVLAVLVATCPCALSLATPAALTAASVRLMKSGMLINNLDAITQVEKIKHWFFDKTGTLTEPYMSIVRVHSIKNHPEEKLLKIAALLEHSSAHPIASAFSDFYNDKYVIKNYKEYSNKGIQADIGKNKWRIGTRKWCAEEVKGDDKSKINTKNTLIYLSKEGQIVAIFELENKIRKGSIDVIRELKEQGNYVAIISGDKEQTVAAVANTLKLGQYLGENSPKQKIDIIKYHQQQGYKTIMIGDGVNDAPVLAGSDVSISFNQGTQLARAASDLIIMGDSLGGILDLVNISKKTNKIITQNILWALFYNLSITPLAVMGVLAPWMAAIGMSLSSLFVVLNARRLLLK